MERSCQVFAWAASLVWSILGFHLSVGMASIQKEPKTQRISPDINHNMCNHSSTSGVYWQRSCHATGCPWRGSSVAWVSLRTEPSGRLGRCGSSSWYHLLLAPSARFSKVTDVREWNASLTQGFTLLWLRMVLLHFLYVHNACRDLN